MARKQLVEYGRLLYDRGLTYGTAGNLSVRIDHDDLLITPSGACKGFLIERDLVRISISDGKTTGGGRPSIEVPFHTALYKHRKDCRSGSPRASSVLYSSSCGWNPIEDRTDAGGGVGPRTCPACSL